MALQTKLIFQLNRFYNYLHRKVNGFSQKTRTFAVRVQGIPHRVKIKIISFLGTPRPVFRTFPRHLAIVAFSPLPNHFQHAIAVTISRFLNELFYSIRYVEATDVPATFHAKNVRERKRGTRDFRLRGTNTFYGFGRQMEEITPADIVLAYTEEPIFSNTYKKAEFLFGEANRILDSSIISLAPLREEFYGRTQNNRLLLERVLKESLHELGHQILYSIDHCLDPSCVMNFSREVGDVDRKRLAFCPDCLEKIGLLHARFNL
ncbi:MAG TPA: archaemetzincin [Candidatus Lokiarchaeia archaeon]|nr:archaemetzincin [Candidatus Lokiarchaeia archaeon]